ncbi:SpoIIE family protein phosphatase [Streptomyces sp. NPDC026673]|uniref:SpoIIE family protein phosphatase n=1 Tax=Streptomyces sp. NPDC026673 TaxID=3155724 RepID=UPI0033E2FF72
MDIQQSAKDVGQPQTAVGQAGVFRDLLPIAMWRIDSEGRITQWSLAAQELFGHTAEEVLGRSATPLLVPVANWELADELTRRVLSGEAVVGTLPVRHRDGHLVTMEMWICPSADPQGRTGLLGIAAETSAVLRMRDSLAALEGLFTQSPIGLAMLGPDLRYVRVNDALARMNGVPAAQHIGRRVSEVVPGLNTMALETVMRQVLARGEPVVDFRGLGYTGADPRERVWSCSFSPLLGGGGRRLGVIATLIDITREERAQAQATRGRQRLALLAEAGTRIGTTLDLRQTAEEVVQVLVPRVADSADLHLLEEVIDPDEATASAQGMVRRLAVAFADPAAPVQDLAVGMTHHVPGASAYEQVMVDGRPLKLTRADIPRLVPGPGYERLRNYLHTLGSARMVPLVARGTVLGIVMVTRSRRREPFDDQDNLLIDELAARAALSIDNARMYSAQRRAALTLQRSLTNTALPTVPGLELAGRYLPASDQEVGGDWFDVIALPGDRTALVIGDVMGHGVHAAAVMGQLRTTVRTLARHDIPPSELLRSLDAAVADVGENEMATCVYAVHDPSDGSCLVARAGHPPPAVATAEGDVAFLDGPTGTPLGVGGQDFQTERVRLPPGSLLVLYTDGLIEARDRNLDQGMLELARALRDLEPPLSRICDRVLGRLLPRGAQDDVAMLLARPLPSTAPSSVPSPVHHGLPR